MYVNIYQKQGDSGNDNDPEHGDKNPSSLRLLIQCQVSLAEPVLNEEGYESSNEALHPAHEKQHAQRTRRNLRGPIIV